MKTPTLSRGLHRTLAAAALLAALVAAPRPAHAAASADDLPLPRYFDQLGLTDDQVQQVYQVMDEYDGKIQAKKELLDKVRGRLPITAVIGLVKAIKNLQARRSDALLQILTDDQRQKLQELQDAGK